MISQTDPPKHTLRFEYEPFQTKITNEVDRGASPTSSSRAMTSRQSITRGYGTALATTESLHVQRRRLRDERNRRRTGTPRNTTYDGEGNRTSMAEPDDDETKWTYDATHDVITTTTPKGETTTIKRESDGDPKPSPDPHPAAKHRRPTTNTTRTANSRASKTHSNRPGNTNTTPTATAPREIDPENNKRTWEYNEDSQEIATVSPRGNATGGEPKFTTKIERDAQGRPIKITDPLGHTTKYTYDGDGNVETRDRPKRPHNDLHLQRRQPADEGRRTQRTVTETEYDGAGQVISQTDGNKHTTKYTRNILEEVTEVTTPSGTKTTRNTTAPATSQTAPTPQDAPRPTNTTPPTGSPKSATPAANPSTVKYEYNEDGDRTKMIDGTGTTTYTYDQLDRLTESENGHRETIKYEYNLGNEQTKITYPNGKPSPAPTTTTGAWKSVTDWLEHTTTSPTTPTQT